MNIVPMDEQVQDPELIEQLSRDMIGNYDEDDELWYGVAGFATYALARGWRKFKGWKASDERTWEHTCGDDCPACMRMMQEYRQAAETAQETIKLLRQIALSEQVPAYFRTDADKILVEGFGIDVHRLPKPA